MKPKEKPGLADVARVYRRTPAGVAVRTYATDWEAWLAWFTAPRRERLGWRAAGDRRPLTKAKERKD